MGAIIPEQKVTKGALIEFQYVPPVIKPAFSSSLLCMLKTQQDPTVVIRSVIAWAFVLRVKPMASGLGGRGRCSWSMRSSWCFEAGMHTNISVELSAVASKESRDGWLLSLLPRLACSAACVLLNLSLFNSHSYPGQQWGMKLLVKTLAN